MSVCYNYCMEIKEILKQIIDSFPERNIKKIVLEGDQTEEYLIKDIRD